MYFTSKSYPRISILTVSGRQKGHVGRQKRHIALLNHLFPFSFENIHPYELSLFFDIVHEILELRPQKNCALFYAFIFFALLNT